MRRVLVVLAIAACGIPIAAQPQPGALPTTASFPLTVDSIMRGPALVGYPPSDLRWSGDSKELYFEWRMPNEDEAATWIVSRDGGQPRRLTDDERRRAPLTNGAWDTQRRRVLGIDRGDIVVVDTVARTRRDITRTTGNESSPRWARGGTHVTFVRDNNLFIVPVEAAAPGLSAAVPATATVPIGTLVQLTDVSARRTDPRLTDSQRVVREEERQLLDWVEREAERRKRREARERARALPKFELAERQTVSDAALSGDEQYAFLVVTERGQARTAQVPRYVSESSYTEEIAARTKVGDAQDRRRLAILNLKTGEGVWAGLVGFSEPVTIPKPPEGDDPGAAPPPSPAPAPPPTKRDLRWGTLLLSPDGRHAVASVRSTDNTDRWLVTVDPASGRTTIVDHVHDEAWVREIGPATNVSGGLGWLPDNKRVWYLAEHDGWMHLYTVDVTAPNPQRRQLTTGRFEIDTVQLSPDGSTFYIQSTEAHPGERHIYTMSVDGGPRTRLTTSSGAYTVEVSPDNTTLGAIHSTATRPPEVYIMPNKPGVSAAPGGGARQVTTSTSPEWRSHKWVEPQLVTYKARDGADVTARLYTPEMVGAKRHASNPAVVFVHGAGYLQNAHRYWSSYYREYMFHHLLASRGYVVLDPDYRASAGYGRDWRAAIFRWMGGKDLEDVVDGAKFLADAHKVQPRRIGVYGGSYGGFITLMAMFTTPDIFAAGAALRPVTDWAHYNHSYTSNILNEPQSDIEAYRKSSPIYFAEGLKGALLILHGMVDTNVHFQDSVRLAQRLIELRKENWELAVYPVEDHGFVEETSWADEYKRILKLFEEKLKNGDNNVRGSERTR
jgi:dipeptidyl aminopeptidase/acylaminoacyl peptidase